MSVSLPLSAATASTDIVTQVNDPDRPLIEQCLAGHPNGFRELYQRHQQRVRSLLFQLCGAVALDDLVQEVFLRAWKGLKGLKHEAKFSTWLYRIAWNVACDYRRQLAMRKLRHQQYLSQREPLTPGLDLRQLHYEDLVQRGLATLPLEYRSVLVMHDLQGLPQKEIAEILGIPVGTVKSRLFRARGTLRTYFTEAGVSL
ncbi:MAG: RNA polymerase sigma factor [Thermosynechococcus sp.]|uniref:sigma-70 family RNA polymerase sigma factor n=1 Tax=Thermosynechococcus sp. TaxID=2814275 RepID=UPI00220E9B7C|nr:sigma-70 family RNA polymerase sigma factor [Thermosynechococcus sp.]BCX12621.1 MAG: RNA polymerase sigma factor [Thermosynechococcus sp.]